MERRNFISKLAMTTGALTVTPVFTYGFDGQKESNNKPIDDVLIYIKNNRIYIHYKAYN
jgi:hypothetical protein